MNIIIKISAICFLTIASSCDSTKKVTEQNSTTIKENITSTEALKTMDTKLQNEGYSYGTVTYLKDSKCSYIIIDEKTNAKFDPINIDDDKFNAFKKEASVIYYKYRPLRMMNRCNKAQPIELIDIKKREG